MAQHNMTDAAGTTNQDDLWLAEYACSNTSQYGEDGIIKKVLGVVASTINGVWNLEVGSGNLYVSEYLEAVEQVLSPQQGPYRLEDI
jgi:hypothetical protein